MLQRFQPSFRFIAAVVMSLWVMATLACAMHCAGLFATGSKASGSCCRPWATVAGAADHGGASHHLPAGSTKPNGAGCLKEFLMGKPGPVATCLGAVQPPWAWPTPAQTDVPIASASCDCQGDRQRCGTPALMLGRGLRTLAPPSSLA